MKIILVEDPVFADAGHTIIDCLVEAVHDDGTPHCKPNGEKWGKLMFTATAYDPEPHGKQLYHDLIDGLYGEIAPYVPPAGG
jgi:hypothetical protein